MNIDGPVSGMLVNFVIPSTVQVIRLLTAVLLVAPWALFENRSNPASDSPFFHLPLLSLVGLLTIDYWITVCHPSSKDVNSAESYL